MAYIEAQVTEEELAAIKAADYDIVKEEKDTAGNITLKIFLDCDLTDLLTPPLCRCCLTEMDDESYGGDTAYYYTCPECGAEEASIRMSGPTNRIGKPTAEIAQTMEDN